MSFFDSSDWLGKIYSCGWRRGTGGTADVFEPATGANIGSYGVAAVEDLQSAVAAAVDAQRAWADTSYSTRAAVLQRAARLVEENKSVFEHWLVREAGSSRKKAEIEAGLTKTRLEAAAAIACLPYGNMLRTSRHDLSFSRRIPAGIVGVISPFNYPNTISARAIAPALVLGNAVILKPDPRTAVSGGLILAEIFRQAGLPEGLFHVLPGDSTLGAELIKHQNIRIISFTGSTQAGVEVAASAARHFKRVHLELGGNNALLVLEDADVDRAASAGAWGSFLHQGQICMTTGRILVHASLYDQYVEKISNIAQRLTVGDGAKTDVDLGPIIDVRQRDRIHRLVTETVTAGATLVAGGTYNGLFYRPTVLADIHQDHVAFSQEVFGPVAPIMKFSSIDDALNIINSSEYGLSLGILSADPIRALKLADRVHSGMVHINDQTVGSEATAPFGGLGASGNGSRYGGPDADIEAFTETQWVTMDGKIPEYAI